MKKIFILTAAVSMLAFNANAQYYQQPQTRTIQYRPTYQAQQQQQYTPHAVCTTCYVQPYIGIDYSLNVVDWGNDEDGDSMDSYVADKLHSGSVNLGMRVHDNFALETYYKKSAKAKKSNSDLFLVPVTTELELQSLGVDAVFHSPRVGYDNNIELLGSVGLGWYEFKLKMNATGLGSESAKDDHVGFRIGAGLQHYLNNNIAFRLMGRYNYTGIKEAKNMFELDVGIRYYF